MRKEGWRRRRRRKRKREKAAVETNTQEMRTPAVVSVEIKGNRTVSHYYMHTLHRATRMLTHPLQEVNGDLR